jgi:predicted alpha/beta superfamily hydrolase
MILKNIKSIKNRYVLLIAFFILSQFKAFSQEVEKVIIGTKYKIESKILNQERTYIVNLPDSYISESTQTYPVIVLIDGGYYFNLFTGIIGEMANNEQVPEMIIIGLSKVDRVKDYTPTNSIISLNGNKDENYLKTSGASKLFLDFIEKELLVEIDNKYRTNSFKIMVGQSFGGLLAATSYLSSRSLFGGYIAIDPSFWWDNQYIVKEIDKINIGQIENNYFYLSSANKYENFSGATHIFELNRNSHDTFYSKLMSRGISYSKIRIQYLEEENHSTSPLLSLYNGLKFIYKDYFLKDIQTKSIDQIEAYYKKIYGGKFLPPESIINNIAYSHLQKENSRELAIQYFKFNVENYPDSFNAYDGLGEAYLMINDKNRALENYKKSLRLNPKNENAKQMIDKLKKE